MVSNNLIKNKEKIYPVELDRFIYRKLNELKAKNSVYEKFLNNLDIFVYDGPTDENFAWKAAVSSKGEMLLNKKYFINAPDLEIEFIIAHELYHVIYGHTKSTPFSWINAIQTQATKYNIVLTEKTVNNILLIVTDFFINPILEYDLEYRCPDALYPFDFGIEFGTIEDMIAQIFEKMQNEKQKNNTQLIPSVELSIDLNANILDINDSNISLYSDDNNANDQNTTNPNTDQETGQIGNNLSSSEDATGSTTTQQNEPNANGNETNTNGSNSNINKDSNSNENQAGKERQISTILDENKPKCYAGEQTEQLFDTHGTYLEELKKIYGKKNVGDLNSIANDKELKEAVINKLNKAIKDLSKNEKEKGNKLSNNSTNNSTDKITSKDKLSEITDHKANTIARLAARELLGRILNDNVSVQTVEIDLKSLLSQLIRKDFKFSPFSTNVIATETRPNYAMPPIRSGNVVIYQKGYLPIENRMNLGIVIDTSGSMSVTVYPKELGRPISYRDYVFYLLKQLIKNNQSSIDKIYVSFSSDDAAVIKYNNSKELNKVNEDIPWNGGTDIPKGITELFKELEKNKDKLDLAIVFTDCETSWNNLPNTENFKKLVKNIYLVKVNDNEEPTIRNNTVKKFFDKQYWANPDTLKVRKSLEM